MVVGAWDPADGQLYFNNGVEMFVYMTADSVLQSGQTEAGDYIASATNGIAGTVLVQF